jgi:two-component system cell cycle sensor histidine kinase/response regulator CckA
MNSVTVAADEAAAVAVQELPDYAPVKPALSKESLAASGWEVTEAADGAAACAVLEGDVPLDILVTDVVMPGMDGPALLREARPWLTKTRVMFISGYAERDLAKTLEDDRAISFLPKPFTLKQLAERVKAELKDAA